MKLNTINVLGDLLPIRRWILLAVCFGFGVLGMNQVVRGQIDGFIEPFRQVELSSDESGAILKLYVEEGNRIKANEVVAKLDDRLQRLQVEIARQLAQSVSQLEAAEKSLEKRKSILARLEALRRDGHAGESELVRADMEESIAQAKYNSARENQIIRQLELQRAELELERRRIRAPFDGVVSQILRREGEFLSPLHPQVVQLIQVDKVLATFAIPSSQVDSLQQNKEYKIEIAGRYTVTGKLHSIDVQTDAQSGTVQVKFVIENEDLVIRAGELCSLQI